ncbi:MAG: ABC transporter permease [Phycisphaerales bacterium]|nr:ABC transporter permease [Planctomycetota bacterium]MCH8507807.1 ABC transporter permease [Phycisphaerales bacterium]
MTDAPPPPPPSGRAPSQPEAVPAMAAPPRHRDNPLTRSPIGLAGIAFLGLMFALCLGTLPWTLATVGDTAVPRYDAGSPREGRLPPIWVGYDARDAARATAAIPEAELERLAAEAGVRPDDLLTAAPEDLPDSVRAAWPRFWLGSDTLGRSLGVRLLAGGGISLSIGIAAALISVCIGTVYGAVAGYAGGKLDSVMMRVVDILYGLPYILLVVLLAVASDALVDEWISRSRAKQTWMEQRVVEVAAERGEAVTRSQARVLITQDRDLDTELSALAAQRYPRREMSEGTRTFLDVATLLVAIGGVSWLTMARVIRGQVLSLKNQPFVEAARAVGSPTKRIFLKHLLPNLIGPIVVYATLAVPQAILQESFLSFLGIGVKPPLPSWGNLAADGLSELNLTRSHWWLLFFPCLLLGLTLLAMNFVGEGLREAFDPKRGR